jgi:hypothetical protein
MWRCTTSLFSRRSSLEVASSATRRSPVRLFEAFVSETIYVGTVLIPVSI